MSKNTKIEWCDHTFNPWIGCTKVSPGCDHCYAEADFDKRRHRVIWGAGQPRSRTKTWGDPVKWNKAHGAFFAKHGRRQRVFCASLADVFDNAVDPQWLSDLFELIRHTPNLDWLLLTKRIGNWKSRLQAVQAHMSAMSSAEPTPRSVSDEESDAMNWIDAWILPNGVDPIPENVWIGATIVNQEEADRDIPKLLAVPAAKRFLSMEPLLSAVDLRFPTKLWGGDRCDHCCNGDRCDDASHYSRQKCPHCRGTGQRKFLDWVIVGGESGPSARPMHPDWARSLRDQCESASVPFLFKQWGEFLPWPQFGDSKVDDPPEQTRFATKEYVDGAWIDVGRPDIWSTRDGDIDDMECVGKVGKKLAGRKLDGRTWDGVPS